jgi:DNA polymerase-3 subunit gamma/tau
LRRQADAGDWRASEALDQLLAERNDLDGLRGRADTYESAAKWLAALLISRAETGDEAAASELTERAGDGDTYAAEGLARLADLTKRVDAADEAAAAVIRSAEVERSAPSNVLIPPLGQPVQETGKPITRPIWGRLARRAASDSLTSKAVASTDAAIDGQAAETEPEVGFSVSDIRRLWPEVLEEVKAKHRFAWVLLSHEARVAGLRNGTLLLAMSNAGTRDSFVTDGSDAVLREAIVTVMGTDFEIETMVDPYANVGRNAPCPCGSGKKFKMCHGWPGASNVSSRDST